MHFIKLSMLITNLEKILVIMGCGPSLESMIKQTGFLICRPVLPCTSVKSVSRKFIGVCYCLTFYKQPCRNPWDRSCFWLVTKLDAVFCFHYTLSDHECRHPSLEIDVHYDDSPSISIAVDVFAHVKSIQHY